mgnify:CR=1 FL=1
MNELKLFKLENSFMKVDILNLGASVYQISLKSSDNKVYDVLSTPKDLETFIINDQSYGRTVGRTAGQIFKNEETSNYIEFNNDKVIKHGGEIRVANAYFDVYEHTETKIVLRHFVKHLSDRYFGDLNIQITYELRDTELYILHEAISNRNSLCRLTFHPYFNLEQSNHLNNHYLKINSNYILDQNEEGMFTNPVSVESKNKDFRTEQKLNINDNYNFDDIFVINDQNNACELRTDLIKMSIATNYPGLVIYTQNSNVRTDLNNANKGAKYSSIAIETQLLQNELPILKKDELYSYYTIYKFEFI